MKTKIGTLELANPVMTASGTFGYGLEYADFVDLNRLGGVVVKGTTLKPRKGNPADRVYETPSGMLNAIGLQNVGVEELLRDKTPPLRKFNCKIIVNIAANSLEEFAELTEYFHPEQVDALEVNISCPNVKEGGIQFGTDPDMAARVTEMVKKHAHVPVWVKLSPNVSDIGAIARKVEAAGADALTMINTLVGMAINIKTGKPYLATGTGGLSGPAIKPVAIAQIYKVAQLVKIPIIGCGGIQNAEDVMEFLMAGATAVQVGTANFVDPSVTMRILDRLAGMAA